ncbi:hypothetical protein LX99_03299 [Mucilaginibacter oryzae]|uniref:Secreted protein (Por secretion system target) n=1 Tax=Mucilaginibacter oryzae TaxID=468058 RepID=A0A316H7T8_9SPHI|nr:hypothetical protein [Mucilaginibacter oryzae]PWK76433.1 hypothetical protein LX99_03299 [Mucilaginibacter oryzae]
MKTSIKLSALFFVLSTIVFAANTASAKDNTDINPKVKQTVSYDLLDHDRGLKLTMAKSESGRTYVRFYSNDGQLIMKDVVNTKTAVSKGYVFSELDLGDYNLEIASDGKVIKETVHVYLDGDQKSFYIAQK